MKKYIMSALLLGAYFSISVSFAQTALVIDTVVDQIDCAVITHPLSLGSKDSKTGGDVTTLQTYLSQANYLDADPTGYFGNATKKAVKAFQLAKGIAPQGNVGPYTRLKIKEISCDTTNTDPVSVTPPVSVISLPPSPVACTMEYRACPDGTAMPRDTNCRWREDKCSSLNSYNYQVSASSIQAPTIKLQYDSNNKESSLVAKFAVKVTAGNTDMMISQPGHGAITPGAYYFNASLTRDINYGGESMIVSGRDSIDQGDYLLIKAGQSETLFIEKTFSPQKMLSGSYVVQLSLYPNYVGGDAKSFVNMATTNSVVVVGEGAYQVINYQIKDNTSQVLGAFASNLTCTDIPRNLIRGAGSSYVTRLQDFLSQKGFLIDVNRGFYGDKTVEAVMDYQASKGLPVTGMVYDLTRQAIKEESCR